MGKIDELRKKLGLPPAPPIRPAFNHPPEIESQQLEPSQTPTFPPSPLFKALTNLNFDAIDPIAFEKLTMTVFEAFGFKGRLTPPSGDHGIDIILENPYGELLCVQCKRYTADQTVSPKEVREFLGAMTYTRAKEGFFVTTSSFSDQCRDFAKDLNLHLIDNFLFRRLLIMAEETYRLYDNKIIEEPEVVLKSCLKSIQKSPII